jgi:hypothetical protein
MKERHTSAVMRAGRAITQQLDALHALIQKEKLETKSKTVPTDILMDISMTSSVSSIDDTDL